MVTVYALGLLFLVYLNVGTLLSQLYWQKQILYSFDQRDVPQILTQLKNFLLKNGVELIFTLKFSSFLSAIALVYYCYWLEWKMRMHYFYDLEWNFVLIILTLLFVCFFCFTIVILMNQASSIVKIYQAFFWALLWLGILYTMSKFLISIYNKIGMKLFEISPYVQKLARNSSNQGYEERILEKLPATVELDRYIFKNILKFKEVRARECMTPRNELKAVEISESIDELKAIFEMDQHSKVIVYEHTLDELVGYCHVVSLFHNPESIQEIIKPVLFVSEVSFVKDVLLMLIQERRSLAVVVDEFGGVSGILTIEDIVEEIIGEIEDEYDTTEVAHEMKINEDTYMFSGRQEIDYLNERYELELPEGDYDTLGGYLFHLFQDYPETNEEIETPNHKFTVKKVSERVIEFVLVTKITNEPKA